MKRLVETDIGDELASFRGHLRQDERLFHGRNKTSTCQRQRLRASKSSLIECFFNQSDELGVPLSKMYQIILVNGVVFPSRLCIDAQCIS